MAANDRGVTHLDAHVPHGCNKIVRGQLPIRKLVQGLPDVRLRVTDTNVST